MGSFRFQNLAKIPRGYLIIASVLFVLGVCTINIQGQSLVNLLAAATSSLKTANVTTYFTPQGATTIRVGDIANIDISIDADTPINALGMTVTFPSDVLEVVGINKEKSFLDLWIEDTVIKEGEGELHFSGGTTKRGGQEGVSTVLSLTVRAKKPGIAELRFSNTQILASDGKGTILEHTEQPFSYQIITPSTGVTSTEGTATRPQPPSPDLNGNGTVTLIDVSILTLRMFAPYDPRYDLDMDGGVGLSDLSVLFAAMRSE